MNKSGFDIHRVNRATQRFGYAARPDLAQSEALDCPFCGRPVTAIEGRIAEHLEYGGFTRCPGAGIQPYIAAAKAQQLTADYRLPEEMAMAYE